MEGMIKLYDAKGVEIGETFARRARQLVKQQRAVWADDTHTAVQFMPDADEEWGLPKEPEPKPTYTEPTPPPAGRHSDALYALAEKRIRDRRWLILHTLALIPVYFFIAIFWDAASGWRMVPMAFIAMGFSWGVWTMFYIYRVRDFIKSHVNSFRPRNWEARRQLQVQVEIERLKRMGFTE